MKTFERLTAWLIDVSASRPIVVLLVWLMLGVAGAVSASHLSEVISNSFNPPRTTESARVARMVNERFSRMAEAHLILVLEGKPGMRSDAPAYVAYERALRAKLLSDPAIDQVITPDQLHFDLGLAPETSFMLMTFKAPVSQDQTVPHLRAEISEVACPAGIEHDLTDMLAIAHDIFGFTTEQLAKVERVGMVLSAVVLVYVFGSLFAACLPLVTGLLCITINNGALTLLAHFFETTTTNQFITAIVGLAIGIDYPLFLMTRVREEFAPGVDPVTAFKRAVHSSGKAIGFSGLIVAVSTLFLALVDVSGLRPAALSVAGVVLTALMLCYSFIPALLFGIGRFVPVERLLRRRFESREGSRAWDRLSGYVVDRPKRHLAMSLALIVLLSVPVLGARFWSPTVSMLPPKLESMRGLALLARAKQAGQLAPIYVTVTAPLRNEAYDPAFIKGLYDFTRDVQADKRVRQVTSMVSFQPGWHLREYQAFFNNPWLRGNSQLGFLVDNRFDGRTALLRVVPSSLPDSEDTRTLIRDLRARFVPAHQAAMRGVVFAVGGEQAQMLDVSDLFARTMPMIAGLNFAAILLILTFYFRSVFLPIKALVVNMLPLMGAFGVVILVFQHGVGARLIGIRAPGYVMMMTPAILLTVLFALSMDYEVIILSRIKEAYDRTGDNRTAILEGLSKSGKVIVGAASIMFSIFAAYVFADLTPMKEVGLGLATAILIDATVVRQILIPSAMMLMGRWNYWFPGAKPVPAPSSEDGKVLTLH